MDRRLGGRELQDEDMYGQAGWSIDSLFFQANISGGRIGEN